MGKIYVNDVGTEIVVDCGSDISTATTTDLLIHKPNGRVATWSGSIYNTNYIKYTTILGDLDEAGDYKIQAYIELPSWSGRGESTSFTVYKGFE